jgi:hypothetical protein
MFVRFRKTAHRLQVSLIETRWAAGKVRSEHVAGLGSIEEPSSVAGRMAFWQALHDRLRRLANRIDAAQQAVIMGKIHERIPIVTPEEKRALQLENATADVKFWSALQDMNEEQAQGHKAMAASAEAKAMQFQTQATEATVETTRLRERIGKLQNGEAVDGGLGKPLGFAEIANILKGAGWTKADLDHCRDVNELVKLAGEGILEIIATKSVNAQQRIARRIVRRMLRERQRN